MMPQVSRIRAIHLRAPTLVQDQVAGDFRKEVADEEHAGAKSEHRLGKAERVLHRQFGEADIHAIEIGAEVAQHEHRHQTPGDLPDGLMLQRIDLRTGGCGGLRCHDVLHGCS